MLEKIRSLFRELADLPPHDRQQYFQIHQTPVDLRVQVEQLLSFDSGYGHFLTNSVAICAAGMLYDADASMESRFCGPYRLLNLIGNGGMGSVYVAERADGEVQQRVAIKLLRYGGHDPAFRARFLQERQILARLNHTAIARLLDAGHTAHGQPYLVMEYVDGVPIDVYAQRLELRQRLRLFQQVCDAVWYAHGNLIVHRDLKPSNILIDQDGHPKLLDFGIAKIIDPAQDQEHTSTALRALTPPYASPEQIRGEVITTASDVYSLGVLLYKLLTGGLPYKFPAETPSVICQTICEAEVVAPGINQDIDNILLMALRKESSRRYLSVQHLADDIERALCDRPVLARPDSVAYRTAKFLRRHRLGAIAAMLVLLSVLGGSIATMYQARIAEKRFQDVRKLAHTFVFDLHDEVAKLEGSTKVREIIVRTGLEYLDNLARNAGGDLDLQKEIATAYMKIGDAEGNQNRPNLGRMNDALVSYHKAGEIFKRLAANNAAYLPDLAKYYVQYAQLVRFNRDLKGARQWAEQGIQILDRIRRSSSLDPQSEQTYTAAWCTVGDMDEDLAEYQRAWASFSHRRELALGRLREKRSFESSMMLAQADERIGTAAQELGRLSEALKALDEDESVLKELLSLQPRNPKLNKRLALVDHYRSSVYYDDQSPSLGDPGRGLESARRYADRTQRLVNNDPSDTSARFSQAIALFNVSFCLSEFDPNGAVTMAKKSVRSFDDLLASGKTTYLIISRRTHALTQLSEAELKAGSIQEALRYGTLAVAGEHALVSENGPEPEENAALVSALMIAGKANAATGNLEFAENLLQEARMQALSIAQNKELQNVILLANVEEALGAFYGRRRVDQARKCYQRLVDLWQHYPEANEYVARRKANAARLLALAG